MSSERDPAPTARAGCSDTARPVCNAPEGCDRPAENPSGRCALHEAARHRTSIVDGVAHRR
jgi:hypothetical protein